MGERGLPALFLSGGEPMMRKNFWEILELARSYGIRVTVSTNCTLMNRDAAKRLKANGIDWIATSLYGPAEFHDAMVGVPGTRDRVIEAIKVLREEGVGVAIKTAISRRPGRTSTTSSPRPRTSTSASSTSATSSPPAAARARTTAASRAEQWRELGDFIVDDILSEESKLEWDIGAMPSFIPFVAEQFIERGIDVSNGLERLKTISACPVGKGHMNINSEGGIMPCQFAQDWTIGNVREMSLQDAVGELYKLDQQESEGVCAPEACEYSRICRGCRAKAWQRTGDPMAEDVTCLLHAEIDRSDARRADRGDAGVRARGAVLGAGGLLAPRPRPSLQTFKGQTLRPQERGPRFRGPSPSLPNSDVQPSSVSRHCVARYGCVTRNAAVLGGA